MNNSKHGKRMKVVPSTNLFTENYIRYCYMWDVELVIRQALSLQLIQHLIKFTFRLDAGPMEGRRILRVYPEDITDMSLGLLRTNRIWNELDLHLQSSKTTYQFYSSYFEDTLRRLFYEFTDHLQTKYQCQLSSFFLNISKHPLYVPWVQSSTLTFVKGKSKEFVEFIELAGMYKEVKKRQIELKLGKSLLLTSDEEKITHYARFGYFGISPGPRVLAILPRTVNGGGIICHLMEEFL